MSLFLLSLCESGGSLAAQSAAAPVITNFPTSGTYAKNAPMRSYLQAFSPDGGYLTYQWKYSIDPEGAGQPIGDNAAVLNDNSPAVAGTYYLWCEVTNNKNGETHTQSTPKVDLRGVDRTRFTSVQHGDFEAYIHFDSNRLSTFSPSDGYWNTTHEGTPDGRIRSTGKGLEVGQGGGAAGYVLSDPNTSMAAELSAYRPSSLYQEIATVPGKIYEWKLDHGARNKGSSNANPDVIAVVIGPAINEASDYDEMGMTSYWNKVDPVEFNGKSISESTSTGLPSGTFIYSYGSNPTDVAPNCALPINGGDYAYGVNLHTHFNAIISQVLSESELSSSSYNANNGKNFNDIDRSYATTYGGKQYYVFISAATRDGYFRTRSGSYSVPKGQGTTVFGFVSVSSPAGPANGNILDNIVFTSSSMTPPTASITYENATSITVENVRSGFAYGLSEVRGSSVSTVASPSAFVGTTSLPLSTSLGDGKWYEVGASGSALVAGSTLVFRNLDPGKTYRVVGV
ncbi:MAG: hypothetical protein LBJ72_00605, partial [Dysgonamonadaceae bacterium]|nr:hypothetical protein [Dysgonamonadaceae bacterium]